MQHPVPVGYYDANDPFGSTAGRRYPHTGSDYAVGTGSTVESIADSVVYHTGFNAGNGNYVCCYIPGRDWDGVDGGLYVAYLHLSEIYVAEGQAVPQGAAIGLSGNSGTNSRGPHLHITMSNSDRAYLGEGAKVDPYAYIQARIGQFGGGGVITPAPLAVDGDFGKQTIRALQRALGVTADGDFGPASTVALQEFLGVAQDGSWGPATTSALQGFLGVTQDGSFGPQTVRALQASLNGGTFVKPVAPAPAPVKPVTPAPNPVKPEPVKPEPVKPEPVKPEPVKPEPIKPAPVNPSKPTRPSLPTKPSKPIKEPVMPTIKPLPEESVTAAHDALGILIPDAKNRKLAYALYGLTSLVVSNAAVGVLAAGIQAPVWLVVSMAVIGNLGAPFATLAIANAANNK